MAIIRGQCLFDQHMKQWLNGIFTLVHIVALHFFRCRSIWEFCNETIRENMVKLGNFVDGDVLQCVMSEV